MDDDDYELVSKEYIQKLKNENQDLKNKFSITHEQQNLKPTLSQNNKHDYININPKEKEEIIPDNTQNVINNNQEYNKSDTNKEKEPPHTINSLIPNNQITIEQIKNLYNEIISQEREIISKGIEDIKYLNKMTLDNIVTKNDLFERKFEESVNSYGHMIITIKNFFEKIENNFIDLKELIADTQIEKNLISNTKPNDNKTLQDNDNNNKNEKTENESDKQPNDQSGTILTMDDIMHPKREKYKENTDNIYNEPYEHKSFEQQKTEIENNKKKPITIPNNINTTTSTNSMPSEELEKIMDKLNEIEEFMQNLRELLSYVKPSDLSIDVNNEEKNNI